MPPIRAIPAICYARTGFCDAKGASAANRASRAARAAGSTGEANGDQRSSATQVHEGADISALIAPPYDVLDAPKKQALQAQDEHNIVTIDLPHLPAKSVGPDQTYERAGAMFRRWLAEGVLVRCERPALFVYQQTYEASRAKQGGKQSFRRRGLLANVRVQPFGAAPVGPGETSRGGIHPHEQTFSGPKEDRLKLMRATRAQLSPIFGLYADPGQTIGARLAQAVESRPADFFGTTAEDGVLHEAWVIDEPAEIAAFSGLYRDKDVFIADGHHRYTTALNYRNELESASGKLPADHPANDCLFALVAMQDPGMIVLPTHRVLGNMAGFSMARFIEASRGELRVQRFEAKAGGGGSADEAAALAALEAALPTAGAHAMGLYAPGDVDMPYAIATTVDADPLALTHGERSRAWRQLDVAILQHLVVERICEPTFCPRGEAVTWKFPHALHQLQQDLGAREGGGAGAYQLGVILQATPLEAVRQVSEAGELMPQKSTFFYPKLATGMVINPLF